MYTCKQVVEDIRNSLNAEQLAESCISCIVEKLEQDWSNFYFVILLSDWIHKKSSSVTEPVVKLDFSQFVLDSAAIANPDVLPENPTFISIYKVDNCGGTNQNNYKSTLLKECESFEEFKKFFDQLNVERQDVTTLAMIDVENKQFRLITKKVL